MEFVNLNAVLPQAKQEGYAVGHFNINGLPWVHAILSAAQEENSPVIIACSDRQIDYLGGFSVVYDMVRDVMDWRKITVPVVLHLDHGQTIENCLAAIDAGFSSVMYDGSHSPIEKNIHDTYRVVQYAKPRKVSVEAEIGTVGGNEDGLVGGIQYANIEECIRLVKEAQVDALAPALGSVHGNYVGEPKLGFKEMEEINALVDVPLVLHGASGIPAEDIKKAILRGHAKINVNTELNKAWLKKARFSMNEAPEDHEVKNVIADANLAIKQTVKEKIREFGSNRCV